MTSSSGPVPVVDGRREGGLDTLRVATGAAAHEDTGGDARDRELEPWKSAISGLSTQGGGSHAPPRPAPRRGPHGGIFSLFSKKHSLEH